MDIDAPLLKTMLDERAILRTLYTYGHAIDYGEEARWTDCFTEDGVFHVEYPGDIPPMRLEGQAALAAFVAGHPRAPAALHKHLLLNPLIDVQGDEARVASYFQMLLEIDGLPETYCFGRYLDRMRRCADGVWRFVERKAEVQSARPNFPNGN
jgi:hypothetical protein